MRRRQVVRPSPERSLQMSLVKGQGNKSTENSLASILRGERIIGWRRHRRIFGRPDFAFPKPRLAVFVDGCFWHGCKRCDRRQPRSNAVFWSQKIRANITRDRKVGRHLRASGWTVVRFWEHDLKNKDAVLRKLGKVMRQAAGRQFEGRGNALQQRGT